jgi:hypothetical protein
MQPTKPAEQSQPDAPAGQDAGAAASPPARKPRTTKPKAAKPEAAASAASEPPAEPATEVSAEPSEDVPASTPAIDAGAEAEAEDVPPENLVPREQFAKMIGYRPTELVGFERKGWLRPIKREDGVSFYNKAEAPEIRQELRRRLQDEADQTRRSRRY